MYENSSENAPEVPWKLAIRGRKDADQAVQVNRGSNNEWASANGIGERKRSRHFLTF